MWSYFVDMLHNVIIEWNNQMLQC